MQTNNSESAQDGLILNDFPYPLILDLTRNVLVPQYVHPKKYLLTATADSTEGNQSLSVLPDKDMTSEQNAILPSIENNHLISSDKEENVEQEKNSQTKRRYIKWTNDDIIILLDYIEVNYGHWMDCKREFYRFIEKNVLKHHTELEMSVKVYRLIFNYLNIRKKKEMGIKVSRNSLKNLPYDRIHEIFGHRKREEYLKETPESLKISKSKKRILQNNGSLGDDEQEESSKNKSKRAKYSRERNISDDDLVNYSEDETPIQRDMSKRPPDWITKRKITPDGVPIYSYGPKIVHQWSRDMMLLFLDCIEENLDVFWKHTYMFWTWLAKNVFTNKTPEALSQKFRQLRPDNKQIRNFKKKPENAKLIEKIERLYQLLNEKRTWSRDRDVNVNFKYPPGYNQEEANSENNITKPLPTVSLKIDESHLKLAKHLLKYSQSDDNADELRKCFGTCEKIQWPQLKENLAPEHVKCEIFDCTDRRVTIAPELEKVLFMRPKSSKTLSKTADASITLYTDESRLEFKPLIYTLNEDLNKKDDLMSQEIGFVTDMVNNFNEQSTKYFRPPTLELRNEADDYMFSMQKYHANFAVEDALRKILDTIGSLHSTVMKGLVHRQDMARLDSEQDNEHINSENFEFTTEHINSDNFEFTTENINLEGHNSNEPTIRWNIILRAAKIAGLPQSVIEKTYYRISKLYDKDKKFEDSVKTMKMGESEFLNDRFYLDGPTQLDIWDMEVE